MDKSTHKKASRLTDISNLQKPAGKATIKLYSNVSESEKFNFTTDFPELTLYDQELTLYDQLEELKPICHNVNSIDMNMDSLMYESPEDEKSNKQHEFLLSLSDDLIPEDGFQLNPSDELSLDIQALLDKTSQNFEIESDTSNQLFPGLLHTESLDIPPILTEGDTTKAEPEASVSELINVIPEGSTILTVEDGTTTLMPHFLQFQNSDSLSEWLATSLIKREEASPVNEAVVITLADQGSEDAAYAAEAPCSTSTLVAGTTLKATPPSKGSSRRRSLTKNSEEYRDRRDRNNVAVRKSRDKSKLKQRETDDRVKDLTTENDRLQKKCDLLTKELNVLKGLFINVGASVPAKVKQYLP